MDGCLPYSASRESTHSTSISPISKLLQISLTPPPKALQRTSVRFTVRWALPGASQRSSESVTVQEEDEQQLHSLSAHAAEM